MYSAVATPLSVEEILEDQMAVNYNSPSRAALIEEIATLYLMSNASIDCIKVIDANGRLVRINQSGCDALGLPRKQPATGLVWVELLPMDVRRRAKRALKVAAQGKMLASLAEASCRDGSPSIGTTY